MSAYRDPSGYPPGTHLSVDLEFCMAVHTFLSPGLPNGVVGVPAEAGKRGNGGESRGNATRMLSCVFPVGARSTCVFADRMSGVRIS